ncbi:alpha-amylase-like [Watersipora subatra]|uniref:alpha-amylase-like n=1 Tax=Watersipora subatra TaxID=2589382 RepID=UPI00355C8ED9
MWRNIGSKVSNGSALPVSFSNNSVAGTTSPQPASMTTSPSDEERTIVFIRKITEYGERLFIRGYGKDMPIPIKYPYMNLQTEKRKTWYHSYKVWSQGDTKLSWDGAENGQGMRNGEKALGSPMLWTSSNSGSNEYVPENTFGDHYWMWEVTMDCSKLPGGYFEFRGFSSKDGYERNVRQEKCLGETTSYGKYPINHVAKCGHKTVVEWGRGNFCIMQRV